VVDTLAVAAAARVLHSYQLNLIALSKVADMIAADRYRRWMLAVLRATSER
jgi:hypothetical protein